MIQISTVGNVPSYIFECCVCSQPLDDIPEASQDATSEEKTKVADLKKKRQEDEFVCRGHILNTLSDRLYDLYMPITFPIEIWKALETKYNIERQGTDKFRIMKYLDFKMLDSIPILDQVHVCKSWSTGFKT